MSDTKLGNWTDGLIGVPTMGDAKSEPFVLQYHSRTSGKNYRQVLDILRRVISENKLEIKVTECAWSEYEALQSELANLKAEVSGLRNILKTADSSRIRFEHNTAEIIEKLRAERDCYLKALEHIDAYWKVSAPKVANIARKSISDGAKLAERKGGG